MKISIILFLLLNFAPQGELRKKYYYSRKGSGMIQFNKIYIPTFTLNYSLLFPFLSLLIFSHAAIFHFLPPCGECII